MRVCDICKANNVSFTKTAVVDNQGTRKELELCPRCHRELCIRESEYRLKAYEETVKARAGEIPHKSHWWNNIAW